MDPLLVTNRIDPVSGCALTHSHVHTEQCVRQTKRATTLLAKGCWLSEDMEMTHVEEEKSYCI